MERPVDLSDVPKSRGTVEFGRRLSARIDYIGRSKLAGIGVSLREIVYRGQEDKNSALNVC